MTGFAQFLSRNVIRPGGVLPLVHSTPALHIREITKKGKLIASPCDVFRGENLNYFFVGRPAYKHKADDGVTPYWELPCCFIFEFSAIAAPERIFPFDSGAFHRRAFPSYINSFASDEFEVGGVSQATDKLIGAFFGSADAYFALQAKDKTQFEGEFTLDVFDVEVRALHRLAQETGPAKFDDRRFAIEIQTSQDIDLTNNKPLAVVAPHVFFDDPSFRSKVENDWQAQPISYPIYSLNVNSYYTAIYERVHEFYRSKGLLP